jgi:hypothetical protein
VSTHAEVAGGVRLIPEIRNLNGNDCVASIQLGMFWFANVWSKPASSSLLCFPDRDQGRPAVAVKQVRVSDLLGRQASEEQFAKLVVHEDPQYQGPITLDVLPALLSRRRCA